MLIRFSVAALLTFTGLVPAAENATNKNDGEKQKMAARPWFASRYYYRGSQNGALTLGLAAIAVNGALAEHANEQRSAGIRRFYTAHGDAPSQTAWKLVNLGPPPRPTYGFFRFKSQPDGADVFVDGLFIGTTPTVEVRQEMGSHAITLRKLGYADWSQNAAIRAGDRIEVFAEMGGRPDAGQKARIIGLD